MQFDWNAIVVAGIVAVPPTVAAVINNNKLKEIHLTMNSRLDELVKASVDVGAQRERDLHSITVQGVPKEVSRAEADEEGQ
jgi:hypothetical protein